MKALPEYTPNDTVCVITEDTLQFIFLQMKPKDATIEMETLHEYTPSGTVCVITEESSFSCNFEVNLDRKKDSTGTY